jgi:NadR type nicotinamide-nucleotide adenylyltransferase
MAAMAARGPGNRQGGFCVTTHIVFHGPESTGKSTLVAEVAAHFHAPRVEEFGRIYCERYGTTLTHDDLLSIFAGHVDATYQAMAAHPRLLISDTDPLMTQAWCRMLFYDRLPQIDAWDDTADLYLVPALDLPWQEDGTRMFGSANDRARFYDIAIDELERRSLRWVQVAGSGDARLAAALAAINEAGLVGA